MDDDNAMLGAYPIETGMRIHVRLPLISLSDKNSNSSFQVVDKNPFKQKNEFDDVSKVEKYEMAQDEYEKRSGLIPFHSNELRRSPTHCVSADSVLAFKARNQLGRFNPELAAKAEEKVHLFIRPLIVGLFQ